MRWHKLHMRSSLRRSIIYIAPQNTYRTKCTQTGWRPICIGPRDRLGRHDSIQVDRWHSVKKSKRRIDYSNKCDLCIVGSQVDILGWLFGATNRKKSLRRDSLNVFILSLYICKWAAFGVHSLHLTTYHVWSDRSSNQTSAFWGDFDHPQIRLRTQDIVGLKILLFKQRYHYLKLVRNRQENVTTCNSIVNRNGENFSLGNSAQSSSSASFACACSNRQQRASEYRHCLLNRIDMNANLTRSDLMAEYRQLDSIMHDNNMVEDSSAIRAINVAIVLIKQKCSKRKTPKGWYKQTAFYCLIGLVRRPLSKLFTSLHALPRCLLHLLPSPFRL